MRARNKAIIVLAGAAAAAATALGGIVDLFDTAGEFDQFSWGQPDTTIYAQSLVADIDGIMDQFRFRAGSTSGGDIDFNIIITGARADAGGGLGLAPNFADIRYNSGQLSVPDSGGGFTEVGVNPNIPVSNGETLFAVLDTFSYPGTGLGFVRATAFNGPDEYVPGEFVFINTGGGGFNTLQDIDNATWSHRFDNGEDLAVFASFVTPAPGAIGLLVVGGLLGSRRRRR